MGEVIKLKSEWPRVEKKHVYIEWYRNMPLGMNCGKEERCSKGATIAWMMYSRSNFAKVAKKLRKNWPPLFDPQEILPPPLTPWKKKLHPQTDSAPLPVKNDSSLRKTPLSKSCKCGISLVERSVFLVAYLLSFSIRSGNASLSLSWISCISIRS